MRFLLIVVFLLFPTVVFGGMGDVYYCSMKQFIRIDNDNVKNYKLENFKFKKTINGLIFGSEEGYFHNTKLKHLIYDNDTTELFAYGDNKGPLLTSLLRYKDGNFYWSQVSYKQVVSSSGTCSKF